MSGADALASDAAARLAALDPARSILLQAPAGSGKTTVLAQRLLGLLAHVEQPEEILAITFTRKAAAEMRERVLAALQGELDGAAANSAEWQALRSAALANARSRGWALGELPSRLRIQTIDALNHELARSLPLQAGSSGGLEVSDDAQLRYARAARQTLLDAEQTPSLRADLERILRRTDNNWRLVETLLAQMLASRAQWLPALVDRAPEALGELVAASLERIVGDALAALWERFGPALRAEAASLAAAVAAQLQSQGAASGAWCDWLSPQAALGADSASRGCWVALAQLVLTQDGKPRKRLDRRDGLPPEQKALKARAMAFIEVLCEEPELLAALHGVTQLPQPGLAVEERAALASLARLLMLAASELKLEFAASGRVDHSEVAAIARQALVSLGDPSELALRRAARLRHLLVDEFQDTSIEQFGLLEALTVGWQNGDGRSLFLVGDPMQSIYLFRNAEVGLFLRARAQGIGDMRLESLRLTRNFRSVAGVVSWVNATFGEAFPPRDDLRSSAVSFLAATATRRASAEPSVHVHALGDNDPVREAQAIASLVLAARSAQKSARIAVLIQARSHAPPILQALQGAGVKVLGIDLDPLGSQLVVREVLALGRALLHPADRTAWLAVLRSSYCGLSLADLDALAGLPQGLLLEHLSDAQVLATLSPDAQVRLARCAPLLSQAWQQRASQRFTDALRVLWQHLGGPAACRDAAEQRQAERLLEAFDALERAGERLDAELLEAQAERLFASAEGAGEDAVEILTIHKAKGLEWDVVIVPGLGRRGRGDAQPLLHWLELPARDGAVDLLIAALSVGEEEADDALARYIRALRTQRSANERARLAYVAVTRARHALHLLGHAPRRGDEQAPTPGSGTLLALLWPAVKGAFAAQAQEDALPPVPHQAQQAPGTAQWRVALPAHWQAPAQEPLELVSLLGTGEEGEPQQPEYAWVGETARAVGTIVHAELERLATRADYQLPPLAQLLAWLRQLGVAQAARAAAANRIREILARTRMQPRAKWILSSSHRAAACELRLTGLIQGRLRNVVIDRTFIDEAGVRWIIDYKTSSHEGADLQGFLLQELERYRPQLQNYCALAAQLGPEPVRAALYFPLLGEFLALPESAAGEREGP